MWMGLAGSVVLLLVLLVVAFSGGKKKPKPAEPKPEPPKVVRSAPRDWYEVGYNRGLDWHERVKNRKMPFTRAEVLETARRMTSDYANRGITEHGEGLFVKGFTRAVLRE